MQLGVIYSWILVEIGPVTAHISKSLKSRHPYLNFFARINTKTGQMTAHTLEKLASEGNALYLNTKKLILVCLWFASSMLTYNVKGHLWANGNELRSCGSYKHA